MSFPKRFGWIGLGAMGYPMAKQLRQNLPSSSSLVIYDIDQDVLHRFARENLGSISVTIAANAKEVAENSDCVVSIVPEGAHVRAVYMTPETGVLATDIDGKLLIDCSTIDPETSLEVGDAVRASACSDSVAHFYDAPVSGGTAGAEKGTLTFMVGTAESDPIFPVLREIFSTMGKSVCPIGGRGLGLAAKLSNNYLSGMVTLATAEAMNLGMRLGIDPKVLSNCFKTSSSSNWVNNTINPVPGVCPDAVTSKGYEGGFKVQLMKKDVTLAIQAANHAGAKLVLANAGLSAYSEASQDPRCKDKDCRVVYRWLGGVEPQ
ncbi:3-hydroxyisobutyrate dehydrogenase [Moniliophthora roreri MCA 2997]|uniref:3-hydroxyisobutyrate dehydrogenase n=1 Tax=Moniliophthora roreri (strain MCA 2997) TaxID=1381753 RepID=V2XUF6_MONRO|nr:3-hydroxyisobutyrate dehydrogenase [Moniliophthora roreri MCA 2997]